MKIDGNQLGGIVPESPANKPGLQETQASEGARRAARLGYRDTAESTPELAVDSRSDQVELSELSRALSLAQTDETREARIDKLASDYAVGRLEIDDGKVASKLVDDAFHSD